MYATLLHSDLFSTASASQAIKKYGVRSSREASFNEDTADRGSGRVKTTM